MRFSHLEQQFVDSGIIIQFWMESCHQLITLPSSHHMAIHLSQYLHILSYLGYIRSPDEGHGYSTQSLEFSLSVKTSQLPSIGISLGQNVHGAQMLCVQHYQTGTCTQNRQSRLYFLAKFLPDVQVLHDACHGGTLSSRYDECLLFLMPVIQVAHQEGFHSHALQYLSVLFESSLQSQYSYLHFPLSAIRSSISCSLIPTIASPRSSLSSASILGLL